MSTERRRHPLMRATAALVGAAFVIALLLGLTELLGTFSLAFPLFYLVGCFLLPWIACNVAAGVSPIRHRRVVIAGVVAGLVPGLAGMWFELYTLDNPFTIDVLRWPAVGAGCGTVIGLYFARRRGSRAA